MSPIQVTLATPDDRDILAPFFGTVAAAQSRHDPEAAETGAQGFRRSLEAYDWLRSENYRLVLAYVNEEAAGYALAARLPKADGRVGFLFVDELFVLPPYRRKGIASVLLKRAQSLAVEMGLAGVRLLVRTGNEAARELYRKAGFRESETIFCEWRREYPD